MSKQIIEDVIHEFYTEKNYGHHKNYDHQMIIREKKPFPWKRFKLYILLNKFLIEKG